MAAYIQVMIESRGEMRYMGAKIGHAQRSPDTELFIFVLCRVLDDCLYRSVPLRQSAVATVQMSSGGARTIFTISFEVSRSSDLPHLISRSEVPMPRATDKCLLRCTLLSYTHTHIDHKPTRSSFTSESIPYST